MVNMAQASPGSVTGIVSRLKTLLSFSPKGRGATERDAGAGVLGELISNQQADAIAAFRAGKFRNAIDICDAILRDHPENADMATLAADAQAALGDYAQAIVRLDPLIGGLKFHPAATLLRAKIAHYSGDHKYALRLLSQLQLVEPLAVSVTQLHARALQALDRDAEATDLLYRALRFQPNSNALLYALARMITEPKEIEELHEVWLRGRRGDASFLKTVRPLITACARGRAFDLAIMLARRATETLLNAEEKIRVDIKDRSLGFADGERALRDVASELSKHEIPYFLAAGTVLGAVREGRLLSFDTDIDIGILEENFDKDALVQIFDKSPNFRIQEIDRTNPKVGLQHWNGVYIDIFLFFRRDGKTWHRGTYTEWWNTMFELAPCKIYDFTVSVPSPAERYLEECYGDWRTPNADFDSFFEGPNAHVFWPEYFDLYLHRKVFELAATKRYKRVLDYCDHFPRQLSWLNMEILRARVQSDDVQYSMPEDAGGADGRNGAQA